MILFFMYHPSVNKAPFLFQTLQIDDNIEEHQTECITVFPPITTYIYNN